MDTLDTFPRMNGGPVLRVVAFAFQPSILAKHATGHCPRPLVGLGFDRAVRVRDIVAKPIRCAA